MAVASTFAKLAILLLETRVNICPYKCKLDLAEVTAGTGSNRHLSAAKSGFMNPRLLQSSLTSEFTQARQIFSTFHF